MLKKGKFLLVVPLAALMLFAILVGSAGATGNPVVYDDWTSGNAAFECAQVGGYTYSYKVDAAAPNGTYTWGGNSITISNSNGYIFDWSSTYGIGAVIVKAGTGANVWFYNPKSTGDTGLYAYENKQISHVTFCWSYDVVVTKDAHTSFIRTYNWDIDKSIDPAELNMFVNDSGEVEYTIDISKLGYTDSDWAVAGTISIFNPDPNYTATITSVSDEISGIGNISVDCGVSFPYALASGDTLYCSYDKNLPNGTNRTNTATATTSGLVGGGSGLAAVTFGAPTTVVNDSINVDDTNGSSWSFGDSGSVSYTRIFACDADEGQHDNTATIRETGQSDSVSVDVNCYALEVSKDAHTSFTRTYNWTIDKVGDQSSLTLSVGQQFLVNYDVTVDATYTDSSWAVDGTIEVYNPAPIAATLNGVSDIVSYTIEATVDCGVAFPYELVAGDTLYCAYSADLPNADSRTNMATATLQNTPSGTTDFMGFANVSFDNATMTEVDKCIDVSDEQYGFLGTVCYDDLPETFSYSLNIGPYEVCGTYKFVNIASFVTDDSDSTGSDSWTVDVNVPCAGCTLTQGYWKTHSERGPAPYDEAWKNLGALEEDTLFFKSGITWYEVFWTAPAGNAYFNLAHQYMAAKLNILDGASAPLNIQLAMAGAETLFNLQGEGDLTLSKTERKLALSLASTLDQYNNGLIGPGHCDE